MIRPMLSGILVSLAILATAYAVLAMSVPARAADCDIAGVASWYGGSHHGRRTASGAVFNQYAMTAAMPPRSHLGERWRVTYKGKSVIVKITDVGPAKRLGRVIDLSYGAARKLGMVQAGLGRVCLKKL
jgi:rare lipoprotein A